MNKDKHLNSSVGHWRTPPESSFLKSFFFFKGILQTLSRNTCQGLSRAGLRSRCGRWLSRPAQGPLNCKAEPEAVHQEPVLFTLQMGLRPSETVQPVQGDPAKRRQAWAGSQGRVSVLSSFAAARDGCHILLQSKQIWSLASSFPVAAFGPKPGSVGETAQDTPEGHLHNCS